MLLAIAALAVSACNRTPYGGRIREAVDTLAKSPPQTDAPPWRIVLHIFGQGKYAQLKQKGTTKNFDALAFFSANAGPSGWVVLRDDIALPMFVNEIDGKPVEPQKHMFLGMLSDSGVNIGYDIGTATGEMRSLRSFLNSAMHDMDPSAMRAATEYKPREDNNALGWIMTTIANFGITEALWYIGTGDTTSMQELVSIAVQRPMTWGGSNGLDEHYGLARALYLHRKHVASENKKKNKKNKGSKLETEPFDVKLTGSWTEAAARLEKVVSAGQKNQRKDGTVTDQWSHSDKGKTDPANLALYTARWLDVVTLSLSKKQLKQKWVRNAVKALCRLAEENTAELEKNPYAAEYTAHALNLYFERMSRDNERIVRICKDAACNKYY